MTPDDINKQVSKIMGREANWHGDDKLLGALTVKAADAIHGTMSLYLDGDNFVPPAVKCCLTYWPFVKVWGCGTTPNEAVCRALIIREKRQGGEDCRASDEDVKGI
jgi:hypothetical protein